MQVAAFTTFGVIFILWGYAQVLTRFVSRSTDQLARWLVARSCKSNFISSTEQQATVKHQALVQVNMSKGCGHRGSQCRRSFCCSAHYIFERTGKESDPHSQPAEAYDATACISLAFQVRAYLFVAVTCPLLLRHMYRTAFRFEVVTTVPTATCTTCITRQFNLSCWN